MKKNQFIILLVIALTVLVSGCSFKPNKITIQKRVGEEETFEAYKEVTSSNKVKAALKIIGYADWQDEEIELDRLPDYQFQFPTPKEKKDKIATYSLWVDPNDKTLEIITEGGLYAKLEKEESTELYDILIGDETENKE